MKTANIIFMSIVIIILISWLNKANADKNDLNKNNSVKSDLDKEHLKKNKMDLSMDNKTASKVMTKPPDFKLSPELAAAKTKCWDNQFFNHSEKSIESKTSSKIINGTDVGRRSALPWMVAIFRKLKKLHDTKFLCGASLISAKFVLTAAHCIVHKKKQNIMEPNQITVRYGMHDLSSKIFTEQGIVSATYHPDYLFQLGSFSDIAILKLKGSAKYSNFVNPICIPYLTTPSHWDLSSKTADVLIAGWGDTASKYIPRKSVNLQKGYGYLVNQTECLKAFKPDFNITTTLCIGSYAKEAKVCFGDSGGPVVPVFPLKKPHNIIFPVALGVNSFGKKYCTGPNVITKVESFIQWINEQTSK